MIVSFACFITLKGLGCYTRIGNSSRSSVLMPTHVPKHIFVPTPCDPSSANHYMPKFMRPFIDKIVDVNGDGNFLFRAIAEYMGFLEESHVMVCKALIREVKDHIYDYILIYGSEERYNCILNGLHPPENSSGHIRVMLMNHDKLYNMVVYDLVVVVVLVLVHLKLSVLITCQNMPTMACCCNADYTICCY